MYTWIRVVCLPFIGSKQRAVNFAFRLPRRDYTRRQGVPNVVR